MKKIISMVLFLAVLCTFALPVFVGCEGNAVTGIEVVAPETEFTAGDTIDYDSLQIVFTYKDGSTKTDLLKNTKAIVSSEADLSKAGETSYCIKYGSLTYVVNINVKQRSETVDLATLFSMPDFYLNYIENSADRAEGEEETQADFRETGCVYEVGNANKFIFRPSVSGPDLVNKVPVTEYNAKTTVKVYEKQNNNEYKEVPETDLEGIVAIEDNTYKFTKEAGGKYFKLAISVDEEAYNITQLDEENRTIVLEVYVLDGGYNVYNQIGLSVMNDLTTRRWAENWGCVVDDNGTVVAGENPLQLEADDKPLYQYVGNIKWAVLHTSFELNADLMPANFFWTEQTEGYATAYDSLSGFSAIQSKLLGSLRDGLNQGSGSDYWYQIMDMDSNGQPVGLGLSVNMQKAFFSTSKVSVSGNYNSITTPLTASKGGRNFYAVVDHDSDSAVNNPAPHWQIFQMTQSNYEGTNKEFVIKNLATTGNCAQQDTEDFVPAGLNMLNCYSQNMSIKNVVANSFYTNVTCDSYGKTNFFADSVKFYNSYSNMFFSWRGTVTITNSDFIGSGGPLFILSDGNRSNKLTDEECEYYPVMTVDSKSVLQAYATGDESWYNLYGAQLLINMIKGNMDTLVFNKLGKTVRVQKKGDLEYVNVIAVMIPEVDQVFTGPDNAKFYLHGQFTTLNEDGSVNDSFNLYNPYVQQMSASVGYDGSKYPPIFQVGEQYLYTDLTDVYAFPQTSLTQNPTAGYGFATDTHGKVCVYMSAGAMSGAQNAPYFAVILDIAQLAQ